MLNNNGQKSILDQIFDEMLKILENDSEFSEKLINRLKVTVKKNFFKNQKDIENALKG